MNRAILALALTLGAAFPALAHGPEKHPPKAAPQAAKPAGTPHAAALGEPGDPKAKTRTIKVVMHEWMDYSPSRIEVAVGETIRFEVLNDGTGKHEMVLGTLDELMEHAALMRKFPEMEHDDPNAVSVAPGKTGVFFWKFTRKGEFDFGCLLPDHFEQGMRGKIVVR